MAELQKYIAKKSSKLSLEGKPFLLGINFNGKTISKGDAETVGRVISTKATKALSLPADGVMGHAVKDNSVCLYSQKVNSSHCYNVRIFTNRGILTGQYCFAKEDIIRCEDEYQSIEGAVRKHEEIMNGLSEQNKKKYEAELKQILKLLEPTDENFSQTNFLERVTFSSGRQIMQMVCTNENGGLYKYNQYYGEKIDDVIVSERDCGDFLLYLPTQWVSAVGYSEERVIKWVNLINSFGLDVPVEYLGIDSRKEYKEYPSLRDFQYGIDPASVINKNEFYLIKINSCECGSINYFLFRLVMSLYHSWTKWIPGLTMQLKEELGDKVTEWEAYLLALNTDTNGIFAEIRNGANSRPRYIKVFSKRSDVRSFVEKLSYSGARPAQGLAYQDVVIEKAQKIDEAFRKKDFDYIYGVFQNLKDK